MELASAGVKVTGRVGFISCAWRTDDVGAVYEPIPDDILRFSGPLLLLFFQRDGKTKLIASELLEGSVLLLW